MNFVGPAGPFTPGIVAWVAMGLDLPGVLLLASIYFGLAKGDGREVRTRRRAIGWGLVLWAGLTAYWRFLLPLVAQTNAQDLFDGLLGGSPAGLALAQASAGVIGEVFGLWVAAAVLYVAVHALLAWDYRRADEGTWVRGLPAYAWLAGAVLSLAGTAAIVAGLWPELSGGMMGPGFLPGAILKLLVAPNVLLSGYVASLRLGRAVGREERAALTPA